jgi:hypothetical protein
MKIAEQNFDVWPVTNESAALLSGQEVAGETARQEPRPTDAELLDAYSDAVVNAAEAVSPSGGED